MGWRSPQTQLCALMADLLGVPHDKPAAPAAQGGLYARGALMMPATTEILADQQVKPRRVRRHWLPALVLLPFVLLMILFQLAPMAWVLVGSVQTPMAGVSTTTGRF